MLAWMMTVGTIVGIPLLFFGIWQVLAFVGMVFLFNLPFALEGWARENADKSKTAAVIDKVCTGLFLAVAACFGVFTFLSLWGTILYLAWKILRPLVTPLMTQ
jgi:hypothetical protein